MGVHEVRHVLGEDDRVPPRSEVGLEVLDRRARRRVLETVLKCEREARGGQRRLEGQTEADTVDDLFQSLVRDQAVRSVC